MGLLTGLPMFQQQMGGGFVGARPGGMSAQEYFQMEAERQARQRAEAMARRQMNQEQQMGDREMTLKERLAQSQMDDSAASQALARDRLGLDSNIASNDANARQNALSLQERLGWAGENRMSRGQDQEEAFRRAQLGQTAELAQLPYRQRTADSIAQGEFNERQLAQTGELARFTHQTPSGGQTLANALGMKQIDSGERMTRYTHGTPSGNVLVGEQGADRRATMADQTTRYTHGTPSGGEMLRDQTANKQMTMQDQLQRYLHNQASGGEMLRDRRTGQELTMREMLEKAKLAQDQTQFEGVSGNNRATIDAQREMHNETLSAGDRRASLEWGSGVEDRALREKIANQSNDTQKLGYLAGLLERSGAQVDSDTSASMLQKLLSGVGVPNSPIANPQERMERSMLNAQRSASRKAVLGEDREPRNPEEQLQVNQHFANAIDEGRAKGWYSAPSIESATRKENSETVRGSKTMLELLNKAEDHRRAVYGSPNLNYRNVGRPLVPNSYVPQ